MSLWFGNEQTYTTIIAEPQRKLIELALSKLKPEDIEEIKDLHPDYDLVEEAESMDDLFKTLPENEKAHPEAYHSFVD